MGKISSILFIAFAGLNAHAAAPVITGFSGVSTSTLTGTITAYGGITDSVCASNDGGTTPCNSCSNTLVACNPAQIYGTLKFVVSATHTDAGNLILLKGDTSNTVISTAPHNSSNVTIMWDTLCQNMDTGTTCAAMAGSKLATYKLCVDKNTDNIWQTGEECVDIRVQLVKVPAGYDVFGTTNSEGVSAFKPFPGDEKAYLTELETSAGMPTFIYGGTFTRLNVYFSSQNMTLSTPDGEFEPVSLPVVENGATLEDSKVDGLTNGTTYYFRVAPVDNAGNIVAFFPAAGADGGTCDTGDKAGCTYDATPDEVLGLLSEDMNCFVATAAYGSSMEPHIDTFREFRFKKLLPHAWGRSFVKSYYKYGPFGARFIAGKPGLQLAARVLLWPMYAFAKLTLLYGWMWASLMTFAATSLMVALPLLGVRSFSSRE